MAKIELQFTPYTRRDPVTGERYTYIRKAHSVQTSKRLKEFQRCIRESMIGKTFRGGSAKENAKAVREAFAAAAKSCGAKI